MSKLAERLRKAFRVDAPAMGFGAASRAANPSLLLTAILPSASADAASQAASRGADTCLITGPEHKDQQVKQVIEALGDVPCGLHVARADADMAAHLAELGVDYAVFDPEEGLATALLESKLGHVLSLEKDLSDIQLRVLEALPLDAVLLGQRNAPLTVRQQIDLQRISALTRKPLILPVSPQVTSAELQVLREVAVVAVAVEVDGKGALDGLAALRKLIDDLPPRQRRREERGEAILPRVAEAPSPTSDEEEEEEESW
jgi:hypothetical protein